MLRILDLFFTLLHLVIIGFNLTGWLWEPTKKLHLYIIFLTAMSWFGLGIWFGLGYCPLTDWQWQVKEKLGERNLPGSFIKYFADKITGLDIRPVIIDSITFIAFVLALVLSLYVNFLRKASAR